MGETSNTTSENGSTYFVEAQDIRPSFYQKHVKPFFALIQKWLIYAWPYIQRVLNTVIYFVINLIKSTIKMAIEQIRTFRGE